ncbi:MAG: proline racemase family protein, partial [Pseudomonadota bacterium]
YLGRIGLGKHKIETPVGVVDIDLIDPNTVRIENVESYCYRTSVCLDVDGVGPVTGSVAWGGNWFFLVDNTLLALKPENIPALTDITRRIRRALAAENITGEAGAEIDHIELFERIETGQANSRNFVLCPGGAYDRSPCGTGTSAKLACLAASGALAEGETWIQESIIGSRFETTYRYADDRSRIIPTLTGNAYVYSDATLIFDDNDPFRWGVG